MNDMIQTGFDYAALQANVAIAARATGERLRMRLKRTVQDIIENGKDLVEIKPQLEGHFDKWFEDETGLERTAAYRFMGAFEKFGNGTLHNATSFSPTVIYLLSAPSTPDAVIEKAIEKSDTGAKVTVADVKDWKAELDAATQRCEEFRHESNERRKTIRELETQIAPPRARAHRGPCGPRLYPRHCSPARTGEPIVNQIKYVKTYLLPRAHG